MIALTFYSPSHPSQAVTNDFVTAFCHKPVNHHHIIITSSHKKIRERARSLNIPLLFTYQFYNIKKKAGSCRVLLLNFNFNHLAIFGFKSRSVHHFIILLSHFFLHSLRMPSAKYHSTTQEAEVKLPQPQSRINIGHEAACRLQSV